MILTLVSVLNRMFYSSIVNVFIQMFINYILMNLDIYLGVHELFLAFKCYNKSNNLSEL